MAGGEAVGDEKVGELAGGELVVVNHQYQHQACQLLIVGFKPFNLIGCDTIINYPSQFHCGTGTL